LPRLVDYPYVWNPLGYSACQIDGVEPEATAVPAEPAPLIGPTAAPLAHTDHLEATGNKVRGRSCGGIALDAIFGLGGSQGLHLGFAW